MHKLLIHHELTSYAPTAHYFVTSPKWKIPYQEFVYGFDKGKPSDVLFEKGSIKFEIENDKITSDRWPESVAPLGRVFETLDSLSAPTLDLAYIDSTIFAQHDSLRVGGQYVIEIPADASKEFKIFSLKGKDKVTIPSLGVDTRIDKVNGLECVGCDDSGKKRLWHL